MSCRIAIRSFFGLPSTGGISTVESDVIGFGVGRAVECGVVADEVVAGTNDADGVEPIG